MSDIRYTETKIYTTSAGAEPVLALLLAHGIDQVSVQDGADLAAIIAAKDELKWDYIDESLTAANEASEAGTAAAAGTAEAVITFYTEADAPGDALLSEIKIGLMKLKADEQYGQYGHGADFGRLYAESLPLADDWKEKWKENFRPFRATPRISVRPSWDTLSGTSDEGSGIAAAPAGEGITITIGPGMAFGTGSHETTSMCLAALEDALSKTGAQCSVLDLGTGTGILAIAAVKLGAAFVAAAEYDEDGLCAARGNIALNDAAGRIKLISGDISDTAVQSGIRKAISNAIRKSTGSAVTNTITDTKDTAAYDIIVANIHKSLLIKLMPDIAAMIKHGGRLILSGLLSEDEEPMTEAVRAAGFTVDHIDRKGEWLAICADFL
ncbi:MAG: 50S ribosomal protein L11 methyltransferase [Clostridiales Family XIII bacterium]|jgi:ribosomal protein L11 methyltransferase|nr:50S ribosomal protein L11 methyltransferase [Clostridiales Family XIII bacterium]